MLNDDRIMASPFKDPERRKEYQREHHKKTWYPDHKGSILSDDGEQL
jgi:hypothetical protein